MSARSSARNRLSVLLSHVRTGSHEVNHLRAKRISSLQLIVSWEGESFVRLVWSETRSMEDPSVLVHGFSDGANNVAIVDDPTGGKRVFFIQAQRTGSHSLSCIPMSEVLRVEKIL